MTWECADERRAKNKEERHVPYAFEEEGDLGVVRH